MERLTNLSLAYEIYDMIDEDINFTNIRNIFIKDIAYNI